jgi:hypothetical protein
VGAGDQLRALCILAVLHHWATLVLFLQFLQMNSGLVFFLKDSLSE